MATATADLATLTQNDWVDMDLQSLAIHSKSSRDLFLFIFAFQELCAPKSSPNGKASKLLRNSEWQILDNNNNGIVSLAESGKYIQDRLQLFYTKEENKRFGLTRDDALLLYKHFYPCFIRAFLDAADYGAPTKVTQKGGGKSYSNTAATGDDYVQYKEFRLFITYLCIYGAIWEAFGEVDGSGKGIDHTDDRRIDLSEWTANGPNLVGHPLLSLSVSANAGPEDVFNAMDSDGKGKVLLAEFSTYIEDYEFQLHTRWGKLLNAGEPVKASAGAAAASGSS